MNATDLLYLVRDNPTLFDAAPVDVDAEAMEWRRNEETHPCRGCGSRARCAVVAETMLGLRWLDLCFRRLHEVRLANS